VLIHSLPQDIVFWSTGCKHHPCCCYHPEHSMWECPAGCGAHHLCVQAAALGPHSSIASRQNTDTGCSKMLHTAGRCVWPQDSPLAGPAAHDIPAARHAQHAQHAQVSPGPSLVTAPPALGPQLGVHPQTAGGGRQRLLLHPSHLALVPIRRLALSPDDCCCCCCCSKWVWL
jgi:hypothetical protein